MYEVALRKRWIGWTWIVYKASDRSFVTQGWSWSYANAIKNSDKYTKLS